jgi:cytochrome c peroxidase
LEIEENNFMDHANQGLNQDFMNAIQIRAGQLGSSLNANQVINRATAMTCGGCHQPSAFGLTEPNSVGDGQTWPDTLGFTHVSEFEFEGSFPISPALQDVFLPARKVDLENFINNPSNVSISFARVSNFKAKSSTTGSSANLKPVVTGKRSG